MMLTMMKHIVSLAAAFALAVPAVALACEGKDGIVKVSLEEGKDFYQKKQVVFVDANGKETRAKLGTIPGAVLLTSYTEFDASKELPGRKDQKLLFYCANNHCGASYQAAKRAKEQGWTNVAVLPEGIMGWQKAGLPTDGGKTAKTTKASAES
jgi:rhodanese-related sulfurtransferase